MAGLTRKGTVMQLRMMFIHSHYDSIRRKYVSYQWEQMSIIWNINSCETSHIPRTMKQLPLWVQMISLKIVLFQGEGELNFQTYVSEGKGVIYLKGLQFFFLRCIWLKNSCKTESPKQLCWNFVQKMHFVICSGSHYVMGKICNDEVPNSCVVLNSGSYTLKCLHKCAPSHSLTVLTFLCTETLMIQVC